MPFFQTADADSGTSKTVYQCTDLTFKPGELAKFITILHYAAYRATLANDTPPTFSNTGPYFNVDKPQGPNLHIASQVIYDKIFKHFVVPNTTYPTLPSRVGDGTVVLRMSTTVVTDLDLVNISNDIQTADTNAVGHYLEGANVFTIWLARERFKAILRQVYLLTGNTPNDVKNKYTANTDPIKFSLFTNMRKILTDNGLIDPLNVTTYTDGTTTIRAFKRFSRILNPDKMPLGNSTELDEDQNLDRSDWNFPKTYTTRQFIRAYFPTIKPATMLLIMQKLYAESNNFITTLTPCIYTKLGGFGDCRDVKRLATGDGDGSSGSGTRGVLDIWLGGILFFPYQFEADGDAIKTLRTEKVSLSLLGNGTENHVIHIGLFGVDNTDNFTITATADGTNSPTINFKDAPRTSVNAGSYVPYDPLDTDPSHNLLDANGYATFLTKDKKSRYGGFDNNTKSLIILDPDAKNMSITLNSIEITGGGAGEIFLSAFSFCQVTQVSPINLAGAFASDRFELTTAQYTSSIVPAMSNDTLNALVALLLDNSTTITGTLIGGFIGRKIKPVVNRSKVESHPGYSLDLPLSKRKPETGTDDPDLRYSFARIDYTNPANPQPKTIVFWIESYASPVYSRLDQRFMGLNLDGTVASGHTPVTDNFDYRNLSPSTSGPSLAKLKTHTVFGMAGENPSAVPAPGYIDLGSLNIPSYNQVLTALRSFGVLEAIFYRIYEYAVANSSSTDAANVLSRLLGVLHLSHTDPNCFFANTGHYGTDQKKLYYDGGTDNDGYKNFKWYTSSTDSNNYNTIE